MLDYRFYDKLPTAGKRSLDELRKDLFTLTESIGERLSGVFHVIPLQKVSETIYRVYMNDGHCFEVGKTPAKEATDGFQHSFIAVWSGSITLTESIAFKLLTILKIENDETTLNNTTDG